MTHLTWIFFDYDLVCVGFPVYGFHPAEAVDQYLTGRFRRYYKEGRVVLGAPTIPGKNAIVFATFAGAHTGMTEPVPATKHVALLFEHLGFKVMDEIHVVGEYHGKIDFNTEGRLGDIRGRPNENDLAAVKQRIEELVKPS